MNVSWWIVASLTLNLARFRANYERLESEISQLARDCQPSRPAPRIIIVSKYLGAEDTARLRAEGIGPLGENRAQELARKTVLREDQEGWHFVGHIQRNKISEVVPRVSLLHAVDSERLARALHHWVDSVACGPLNCLVQVNVAGETRKGGLAPLEAERELARWIAQYENLRIRGLMTMAPLAAEEECRMLFQGLSELRDTIRGSLSGASQEGFQELSMGMSNDYRVAVEEGATLVRLGRILYE